MHFSPERKTYLYFQKYILDTVKKKIPPNVYALKTWGFFYEIMLKSFS